MRYHAVHCHSVPKPQVVLQSAVAENVDEELEFRKQRAQALMRLQQDLQDELQRYDDRKKQLEEEAGGKHVQYRLVLGKRTVSIEHAHRIVVSTIDLYRAAAFGI
jgi:hypothetical protein